MIRFSVGSPPLAFLWHLIVEPDPPASKTVAVGKAECGFEPRRGWKAQPIDELWIAVECNLDHGLCPRCAKKRPDVLAAFALFRSGRKAS
jgi:hypothetical protein